MDSAFDPTLYETYAPNTHRPGLYRFAFDQSQFDISSSPTQVAQLSSPAYRAGQRQTVRNQRSQRGGGIDESTTIRGERRPGISSLSQPYQPAPPLSVSRFDTGPPVVQGISLKSTQDLPDRFRPLFPFPLFNAVQSKCFDTVFRGNENFVLASPTGSGKTALFELAICRLLNCYAAGSYKVVYQAPTKSLCSERFRDWQAKFGPLDLQCAELTGDTNNKEMHNVQHAAIIITTPEKWDSMTRKWKDHQRLMQMVKLFLIDEVHILKEDRGATLEAVVSRMKSVGSDVRFIALSATVPNAHDVALWLGRNHVEPYHPALLEKFGEEFRPVRLQKHVCGYQSNGNDFAFDKVLNSKLTGIVTKYSRRKPIMVFCCTRSICLQTAKLLANWWATKGPHDRAWNAPKGKVFVSDKDLRGLVNDRLVQPLSELTSLCRSCHFWRCFPPRWSHGARSQCHREGLPGRRCQCHLLHVHSGDGSQFALPYGDCQEYCGLPKRCLGWLERILGP